MIKAVRNGWPYMENWERGLLIGLFPLWGLVWCGIWVRYATPGLVRIMMTKALP